jgi:hypothetical protein
MYIHAKAKWPTESLDGLVGKMGRPLALFGRRGKGKVKSGPRFARFGGSNEEADPSLCSG